MENYFTKKNIILGRAFALALVGLEVVTDIRKANSKFGTIANETVQDNREVSIAVKSKEGNKYFVNCNPRLLRTYFELNKDSSIVGRKITYSQIENACPSDPNLIKEAQAQKNNNK